MSAANLDEIKRKYNFKEISVATWRDPSLSVHPARGGPDSPRFSPNVPFIPTYKTDYDSTDDEGSVNPGIDEADAEEVSTESILEDPFDEPPTVEQQSEIPIVQLPEDEQGFESADQIDELDQIEERNPDLPQADVESAMTNENDLDKSETAASAPTDMPGEEDHPPETGDSDPISLEPGDDGGEGDATPPSDTGSDERRVSFAPGTPDPKPTPRKKKPAKGTKGKKKRIAVPIDSLPADVMAMIDGAFDGLPPPPPLPPAAPEPPIEDDVALDDASKEFEPLDQEHPDSQLPQGDVIEQSGPTAASDEAAPHIDGDLPTEVPAQTMPEESPEIQEAEQPAEETIVPVAPKDPEAAMEPIEETPLPIEKSSKKKSSKSGKDKDKPKKKSSKTKSRDASPPPTGLGIDLPPPPPPPPLEMGDSVGEVQDVASAEHQEAAIDTLPPEDAKTQDETQNKANDDPGNGDQDALVADSLPEHTDEQPRDNEASTTEQPVESSEGIDTVKDDLTRGLDANESKATAQQDEEGQQNVPDAWDEPENAAEPANPPAAARDEHVTEATPLDSASSPTDSGVEFNDDAPKATGIDVEAENPAPVEESVPSAAVDHVEHVDTGAAADDEATGEQPDGSESALKVPEAAEDGPNSSVDDQQVQAPEEGVGELSVQDEVPGSEPTPDPNNAVSETLQQDKEAEGLLADPIEESGSNEAQIDEVTEVAADQEAAVPEDKSSDENSGEPDAGAISEEILPSENAAAEPETAIYEPPSVESVEDEPKVNPFEFEVAPEPGEGQSAETQQENSKEADLAVEAPPSPVLSKSGSQGSQKQKADHWERKHADNVLKEVFEDSKVLERSHGTSKNGKDEIRVKDRHRKSRRLSSSGEDDKERRRRRAERKANEAARMAEEESRKAEEERKYQERRATRKRVAEESTVQRGAETRERHRSRDSDRGEARSTRTLKSTLPFALSGIPKALNLTSGESVHGAAVVRSYGGAYRPAAKEATKATAPTSAPREEAAPKEVPKETRNGSPPSSGGEKSHHRHRHRRHRSDGDRSSRNDKESDRHHRRPPVVEERVQERPRSLFGLVRI